MATLYLGRRTGASGFSKPVAIKVVHPHLAEDPSFVTMFVDEALLSARINHPNVVHVEELREVEGAHLLVMEYVAGCSLAQLLKGLAKRQRRMTPELAVHVAIQVLDGLHAAHELKDDGGQAMEVVHRDVSPDNVLLAWQGHVKLIDFGVAKALSRSTRTQGAMLKGKLRYMSPEQARGAASVDRRTDVYALAIVLWECLTMRRAFSGGNDLEVLDQVRNPEIAPPSRLVPDLPPGLDAILMRALAKDPAERYASARDFRRDLAKALPAAAALDGADLAELLRVVMSDEVEAQRALLSSAADSLDVPSLVVSVDEEPLRTMTVSMAGLEAGLGLLSGASALSSTGAMESHTPSTVAAEPSPRARVGLIAVAALALVGVAAGATVVLLGGEEPVPTVTPLATPTATPPVEIIEATPARPQGDDAPAATDAIVAPVAQEVVEAPAAEVAEVEVPQRVGSDVPRAERDTVRTPSSPRNATPMRATSMREPGSESPTRMRVLADEFGF